MIESCSSSVAMRLWIIIFLRALTTFRVYLLTDVWDIGCCRRCRLTLLFDQIAKTPSSKLAKRAGIGNIFGINYQFISVKRFIDAHIHQHPSMRRKLCGNN